MTSSCRWIRRAAGTLASCAALVGLAGCATLTSGSMRVEVDVYKGPLALELRDQGSEFAALLCEGANSFAKFYRQIMISRCHLACAPDGHATDSTLTGCTTNSSAATNAPGSNRRRKTLHSKSASAMCNIKSITWYPNGSVSPEAPLEPKGGVGHRPGILARGESPNPPKTHPAL